VPPQTRKPKSQPTKTLRSPSPYNQSVQAREFAFFAPVPVLVKKSPAVVGEPHVGGEYDNRAYWPTGWSDDHGERMLVMRLRAFRLALVLLLFVGIMLQAAEGNAYWQRVMGGFVNPVEVYEYTYEYQGPELELTAKVPQLIGGFDLVWQEAFNLGLRQRLEDYVAEMKSVAAQAWELYDEEYRPYPYEGIMDFEVKLNQGGLLSIAIVNYSYTGGAHGMTTYDYINLDLTTGKAIGFYELFDTDAELERVIALINERIAEEEWFFIDSFTFDHFHEEQGFYLQDAEAVVCFGLYELAPYVAGVQEFKITPPEGSLD
jgi:hypothetical protein